MAKNRNSSSETKVLSTQLFLDDSVSVGGRVKAKGEVIKQQVEVFGRPPNMKCRIETFSRICHTFDERRTRWVNEMGFGGLLNIPMDMHLPRQLGYWLMSRIDPLVIGLHIIKICHHGLCISTSHLQSPLLIHLVLKILHARQSYVLKP
ncbi:uncharacterized protein LOC110684191 [Chenopodium quinoa]|uniref:uncharacterized protein LOC110684191 n=1 Tax=Chenopodium quinoa TaxID=63459 RepID=UPI000B781600|nr:uncharacterized protein LOC110684191 [Chenopodium quinoa]